MRTLAKLLAMLLLIVLHGESPVRAETRVQVEVILLTCTYQQRPQPAMQEQLAEYFKALEHSEDSLVSLLDLWLEGRDRTEFTVDALQITTPMGQEIDVVSQQTLPQQKHPLVQRVPNLDEFFPLGTKMSMLTAEASEGRIQIELRFSKRVIHELQLEEETHGKDAQLVPAVSSVWMDSRPTLRPGATHIQAGLLQSKKTAQGDATCEAILLVRARRAPALMHK